MILLQECITIKSTQVHISTHVHKSTNIIMNRIHYTQHDVSWCLVVCSLVHLCLHL